MALSEKERLDKLLKANTMEKIIALYEQIFKVKVPLIYSIDPNDLIKVLVEAIETNLRYEGETVPNDVDT